MPISGPWKSKRFRLFISHRHSDSELAYTIKKELAKYGIDGFVAHVDITPSKEWQEEIVKALDTCDAITPLLTENFRDSKWTDQEVGYCIGRGVKVLSLNFSLTPYGLMGRYQAMNCSALQPPTIANRIFNILVKDETTGLKITNGLIGLLERTTDYTELVRISKLLETSVVYWNAEHLQRLENMLRTNINVQNAWHVPERLRRIIFRLRRRQLP